MGEEKSKSRQVWALSRAQHNAIELGQLREIGYSDKAIYHRLGSGRLHKTPWRGVYAIGRPDLTRLGTLMAAVLASGESSALCFNVAAELYGVRKAWPGDIDVMSPKVRKKRKGIQPHCRTGIATTTVHGIPVTTIVETLVDIRATEADVIAADKLDLVHVGDLRAALEQIAPRPGVPALKRLIDRHTFRLTDSELERWFLRIVRRLGLPLPETQVWLNGVRVDFYWPELGIVVEADGARFHRTAIHQTSDVRRDQRHLIAGLLPLRFTHWQIRYEPGEVEAVLSAAATFRAGAA
jgi:very-short-patch-repair endonuclease